MKRIGLVTVFLVWIAAPPLVAVLGGPVSGPWIENWAVFSRVTNAEICAGRIAVSDDRETWTSVDLRNRRADGSRVLFRTGFITSPEQSEAYSRATCAKTKSRFVRWTLDCLTAEHTWSKVKDNEIVDCSAESSPRI